MAYGVLYEFRRTSTNGADMLITISKKGYGGAINKRALGRAPIIKRDNNGHIYGTSCELYAECLVDGEFSHLYTSDAYEYKVEVYKNNTLLWAGFVSPELYSEPDIAPPYDVQIIATDGLGELKNYNFQPRGIASILDHLDALMTRTGLELDFEVVSALKYINADGTASYESGVLGVKLDLDHEEGNSYYDVLQNLLSSLNASITQHNGRYLIFRETDFISKAGSAGVEAFDFYGSKINLPVASFGSMKSNQWWPVGQFSTLIEPAKNHLTLQSPNHYKGNALNFDNWELSELASYSEADNAYILPGASSSMTQTVDFAGHEVGYRLALAIRARNVGAAGDDPQNIGIKVEVDGRSYSVGKKFWLVKSANNSGRPINDYLFRSTEGYIEEDLPTPTEGATSSDAQDINIVLPLHTSGSRSYVYANNIKLTIFNPLGLYNIHVYDVSLVKYEQTKGYEANVTIENMARESEPDINLTITAGDLAPAAGNVFMSGLPLRPLDSEIVTRWQIGLNQAQDYLSLMAFDYSRQVSLPRMKYSGILNVPAAAILPTLFLRDGTYYFPKTYSYDLYADEITVDLVSISAADVSLSSVQVVQISEATGTLGTTTGGSAGAVGGSLYLRDLLDVNIETATKDSVLYFDGNKWINKELSGLLSDSALNTQISQILDWFTLKDGVLLTKYNLASEKEVSALGINASQGGGGGSSFSRLDSWADYDSNKAGYVLSALLGYDLNSRLTVVENKKVDLSGYYTKEQTDAKISSAVGAIDFTPYAKSADVAKNYATIAALNLIDSRVGTLEKAGYATTGYVDSAVSGIDFTPYAKKKDVADTYATKESLTSSINGLNISQYAKSSDVAQTYATKNELTSSINGLNISQYATTAVLNKAISDLNISQYAKSTDVASTYATIAALNGLTGLHNTLRGEFDALNSLLNDDTAGVIDTWNEVVDFINEYSGKEDLSAILAGMNADIASRHLTSDFNTWVTNTYTPLANRVGQAESKISTHTNQIGGLTTRMGTAEENIGKNATAIENNKSDIDKLLGWFKIDSDGNVYTEHNFYSTQQISAKGLNAGGGSGSSYNRLDAWTDYDSSKAGYVLSALLGHDLHSRVTTLENKKVDLSDYYTKAQTDSKISSAVGAIDFSPYATKGELSSSIAELNVAQYAKITDVSKTYATKNELSSAISGIDFSPYATKGELSSAIAGIDFSPYAKTSDIAKTYATKNELSVAIDEINKLDLNNRVQIIENSYVSKNIGGVINGGLTVNSLAVAGGTSSQFLKADGSLDSNTYLTSVSWSQVNGRPTNLSQFTDDVVSGKYLPLTGGTLRGKLYLHGNEDQNYITFQKNGATQGYLGFNGVDNPMFIPSAANVIYPLIHSGNYSQYAPTLTGTGASGTWGISAYGLAKVGANTSGRYNANELTSGGMMVNGSSFSLWDNAPIEDVGSIIHFSPNRELYYSLQLCVNGWTHDLFVRNFKPDGVWNGWKQFAFTDSNVASATKLQTPRTIWEQSFDGTGNVSGDISLNASKIYWQKAPDTYYIGWTSKGDNLLEYSDWYGHRFIAGNKTVMQINGQGNITIGDGDYAGTNERLYVAGDINAKGRIYVADELFFAKGAQGSYYNNEAIAWHDENNNYVNLLLKFKSDAITLSQNTSINGTLSVLSALTVAGTTTANTIKIKVGQALQFEDNNGVVHSLRYDSAKQAFVFDGNVNATGEMSAHTINA